MKNDYLLCLAPHLAEILRMARTILAFSPSLKALHSSVSHIPEKKNYNRIVKLHNLYYSLMQINENDDEFLSIAILYILQRGTFFASLLLKSWTFLAATMTTARSPLHF